MLYTVCYSIHIAELFQGEPGKKTPETGGKQQRLFIKLSKGQKKRGMRWALENRRIVWKAPKRKEDLATPKVREAVLGQFSSGDFSPLEAARLSSSRCSFKAFHSWNGPEMGPDCMKFFQAYKYTCGREGMRQRLIWERTGGKKEKSRRREGRGLTYFSPGLCT